MFVLHASAKGTYLDVFKDVRESPHYLFFLQHKTKCKTKINSKSIEREGEEESCVVVVVRLPCHHHHESPLFYSFSFPFQLFRFTVPFQIIAEPEFRAPKNVFMHYYKIYFT